MGKLYKIDGTVTEITPKDPKRGFTLEECYKYIKCNLIDAKCLGDKAHFEIETAKMIILNFDDLNQEVEDDEINRILAK